MTTKTLCVLLALLAPCTLLAQRGIDFNACWDMGGKPVTLPRAWNEEYAFRVPIEKLPADTVRYTKRFDAPKAWKGKKVFIEFEGARQAAEVWLNGHRLGLHQNGVMAFGFDLTPYIKVGKSNVLEVLTDNDWGYKEKRAATAEAGGEEAKPVGYQWNNKNFNANYGGLPKNVQLHVTPLLYQTLPLYSCLGTTGTYVYAKDFDIAGHAATIHAESEVRNETGKAQTVTFEVEVTDRQTGRTVMTAASAPRTIGKGETVTLEAEARAEGLHFWSWGYGYLYDVKTKVGSDVAVTTTGFRKTEFGNGQTRLNDRTIMVHGYAQRTSNEWPGVGMSVPAWMSDYSNRFVVESGGNLVRWMHVCPWKQDVESCDRVGLMQAMPAGDAEKDAAGRQWEQRTELMRDAIIYNRNNPSIVFYECGNKGISEAHMAEMKAIRDRYDPHGGRAIGSREMLSAASVAEYGGEMLYINKSDTKPMWAMEYCRDEALRRYWDDWSYPYHKHGDGPLYRNADASAYNQNNDQFAIEMVRRWWDYWRERPGTGARVSGGGVKIVFSDTNTHCRGESNYRTSGVVDAMRIPKDAFYAHRVMWDGWVTPEASHTHIVGHWNYEAGTVKPVYVVSDAPCVRLYLNGREVGSGKTDYHFMHTFDSIAWEAGTLKAVSYDGDGRVLSEHQIATAGAPVGLRVTSLHPLGDKLNADGADITLMEVEAVDAEGRRCPTDNTMLHCEVEGPVEWIGGIGKGEGNCVRSKNLPLECGVNRFMLRSTGGKGEAKVLLQSPLGAAVATIDCGEYAVPTPSCLMRGETPATASYTDIFTTLRPAGVKAGCSQETAHQSIDNSENTEWKNDGRAQTAWITYDLGAPARVDEVVMKLTGWRQRSYPLEILAGDSVVWTGSTPQSLGYVHLPIDKPVTAQTLTIRLKGTARSEEAFGQIVELAAPVANDLDLFKAKDGDKVKSELRIVECDLLQRVER